MKINTLLKLEELRRPAVDYLRDGIYELRAKHIRVQYRILYFFSGQNVAILAHAITKDEAQVPDMEIERAVQRSLTTIPSYERSLFQVMLKLRSPKQLLLKLISLFLAQINSVIG